MRCRELTSSSLFVRDRHAGPYFFRSRLDRAMELALALKYVHGGAGIGTMMHRDIKSVSGGGGGGGGGLSAISDFWGDRRRGISIPSIKRVHLRFTYVYLPKH